MKHKKSLAQAENSAQVNLSPSGQMIQIRRDEVRTKATAGDDPVFVTSAERLGLAPSTLPVRVSFPDRDGVMQSYQVFVAIGDVTGEINGFRYRLTNEKYNKSHALEIYTTEKKVIL